MRPEILNSLFAEVETLPGVGPQLEKKLNDYGIFHYWQLAALNEADTAAVETDLKTGGKIAGWAAQARELLPA